MRGYIEFCVGQRKEAKKVGNEFLVDFWKLMMNSVFGKTMENIRKRIRFELVSNSKRLRKLVSKPFFKDISVYVLGDDEDDKNFLVGVHLGNPEIELNKPIYTGQCIVDNSKWEMYQFVYDYCIPKWGIENFKICQTDTDSVFCEIKTKDLPKDIVNDIEKEFDTSKLKKTNFDGTILPKVNRKVLGKMKDELSGQWMTEFVGSGPKNYEFEYIKLDGEVDEKSICKGISMSCTPKFHEHRAVVLGEKNEAKKTCFRISSKEHELYTIQTNKVAITNQLRKRVRDPTNRFETLPFGAELMFKS